MPRQPKLEKKTGAVVVDGQPVAVVLHPPADARKSWYAYWSGLVASKSTGRSRFDDAVVSWERLRAGIADMDAMHGCCTQTDLEHRVSYARVVPR